MKIITTPVRSTVFALPDEPVGIIVAGYFYAVDLSENVRPQHHRVGINGTCTCSLGRSCPAVEQVRIYLAGGGKRAARPPFGFYPVAPAKCPVCGEPIAVDASLSSVNRGTGFRCSVGGKSHYWQHRAWISARRAKLAKSGHTA